MNTLNDKLLAIIDLVNKFVWGPPIIVLIMGTGIFMTIRTKFFTFTKLGYIFNRTLFDAFRPQEKSEDDAAGEITPFQAMSTALAGTLGTGSIAGVATAITLGGPGAIFWMWISALFGMATKYSEVVLSIQYRQKNEYGAFVGGPMYYLKNGLKSSKLAAMFAIFASIAALGTGNMIQSNAIAQSLDVTFGFNKMIVGIVLAVVVGMALVGGLKRIASITEKLVPLMALFYVAGGLLVIILNFNKVPAAFGEIFRLAFTPQAAVGGFAGSTMALAMRAGIARGIFSNESGLGTAPIAHAPAKVDHPVKQGFWGVFEVFMASIVVCTMTALAIIISGAWKGDLSGAALTTEAFTMALPGKLGGYVVSIGLLFFALSTILSWSYYGEVCLEFLFGEKIKSVYRAIWIPLVAVGAVSQLDVLWGASDIFNGLMVIPNLIGVFGLSKVVADLTKDYFQNHM